jgi:hypothetical protein
MFHDPESDELQTLLKQLTLTNKKWKSGGNVHSILKYTTGSLNRDQLQTLGLLRSVVLDQHGKILAYSPPKCVDPTPTELSERFSDDNLLVEELVEGTMINVFYHKPNGQEDGAEWDLATKSCVGAKIVFHSFANKPKPNEPNEPNATINEPNETNATINEPNETNEANEAINEPKKTFRRMFLECMNESGLEFDALQKDCCYSFVMQHPNNHIVRSISKPTLYLIAVYKADNENLVVEEQCRDEHLARINSNTNTNTNTNEKTLVRLPLQFTDVDLRVLQDIYTSLNAPYDFPGLVCRERSTGARFKFRNPNYERAKNLRGSEAKLQFQYLSLRQQGKVNEHLNLYPEHSEAFEKVRDQLHAYTTQLFENYIGCYVKKDRPFPAEFKTNMFQLHQLYKEKKEHITLEKTIAYINGLYPSYQMYSLNYGVRKSCLEK